MASQVGEDRAIGAGPTFGATGAAPGPDPDKMPGHWLLARMGKRVLRPGGLRLTRWMLDGLAIGPGDAVVEFAPGLGVTARLTLARNPARYTAIERDEAAAETVRRLLDGPGRDCLVAGAERTGLPDGVATVVYGEAMLTMQAPSTKEKIGREAHRLLRPGGRYAIHELCLVPDGLSEGEQDAIRGALSGAIHVGARPLTPRAWRALLEEAGFVVRTGRIVPMRLLEPRRVVQDEGLIGAARFVANVLRDPTARRRVGEMRRAFRAHAPHLGAIALVAHKPEE
jgi:SAM-dependent methyltransferase